MILRTALCVMLPGGALAQEPWQGAWAYDPQWCAVADQIGSVTPAPIRLTDDEFWGYENTCAIVQADDLELNAWVMLLECQSEGDTYDENRLVMVDGDEMWMWSGMGSPTKFQRCAE